LADGALGLPDKVHGQAKEFERARWMALALTGIDPGVLTGMDPPAMSWSADFPGGDQGCGEGR